MVLIKFPGKENSPWHRDTLNHGLTDRMLRMAWLLFSIAGLLIPFLFLIIKFENLTLPVHIEGETKLGQSLQNFLWREREIIYTSNGTNPSNINHRTPSSNFTLKKERDRWRSMCFINYTGGVPGSQSWEIINMIKLH